MSTIYGYNNQLWKVVKEFNYTGEPEPFTLNPGKHLIICNGAMGGANTNGYTKLHGATTYGIINNNKPLDMYAVVGGNGGDGGTNIIGEGGYNGGGKGGTPHPSYPRGGSGGGGASDVRLSIDETPVTVTHPYTPPEGYEFVEYVEANGNQYINVNYYPRAITDIEVDCEFTPNETLGYNALFGTRYKKSSSFLNQFVFFTRFGSKNSPCFGCNTVETSTISGERSSNLLNIANFSASLSSEYYKETKTTFKLSTGKTYTLSYRATSSIPDFIASVLWGTDSSSTATQDIAYVNKVSEDDNLYSVTFTVPDIVGSNIVLFIRFVRYRDRVSCNYNVSDIMLTEGTEIVPYEPYEYKDVIPVKERVIVKSNGNKMSWYYPNTERPIGSIQSSQIRIQTVSPLFIFDLNNSNNAYYTTSVDGSRSDTKIFGINIYEGDVIIKRYVPVRTIEETPVYGLYDLIDGQFFKSATSTPLLGGEPLSDQHVYFEDKINPSLLSRIMVAAGGGGQLNVTYDTGRPNYFGVGGGLRGGELYDSSGKYLHKTPTQTNGYMFGQGETPLPKLDTSSYSAEGASGGGGGWFGGSATYFQRDKTYDATNGQGGSSYVLSEDSYKPFMYSPNSDYYFTDTMMTGGTAEEPCILICDLTKVYFAGDKIIFPMIGKTEKMPLYMGEYKFACWGCDGCARDYLESASRGGYAEGILLNKEINEAYFTVGRSGIRAAFQYQKDIDTICIPMGFNGGGSHNADTYGRGGGATDVRIGSDSLYARLIVAGGAGGHGAAEVSSSRFGGAGGGASGNNPNQSDYGTVPGPGTQTGSPAYASRPEVAGGFGYGGNGFYENGGYGGAGGGGWFGGSGCIPDGRTDDDRGGAGGSGYVLTNSSFKPEGYLLDEKYYLSNTVMTTGGNNLRRGQAKIEVDVLDALYVKYLIYDEEGSKYFDKELNKWVIYSRNVPKTEDFEQYPLYEIKSFEGIVGNYQIYVFDEYNVFTKATITVIPNTQHARIRKYTTFLFDKYTLDSEIDENVLDMNIIVKRAGIAEDAHFDFDITADFLSKPVFDQKIFAIYCKGIGRSGQDHQSPPKEKTLDHIDLLPVGTANTIQFRYKNYVGGFLSDGTPISSIQTSCCCEHNRFLYSCILCNNTTNVIARLNLIDNTVEKLREVPLGGVLGGTRGHGGILVDDNNIYLSSSIINGSPWIWVVPIDKEKPIQSYQCASGNAYYYQCYGKMEWYDESHFVLINYTGLMLFDVNKHIWTYKNNSNNSVRYDMCSGKRYIMNIYNGNSTSGWAFDKENETWIGLESGLNITWTQNAQNACCYDNGFFYVVQKGYLHILNEDLEMVKVVPTPFTSTNPQGITSSNGIVYIILQNSKNLYIYNTKTNLFEIVILPFTIPTPSDQAFVRIFSFSNYAFIPYIKLFVINGVTRAKYNMGYKYESYTIKTDKSNIDEFEYDDRFITINDEYMSIHVGDIEKEYEQQSELIKTINIDTSEFKELLSFNPIYTKKNDEEEEGNVDGLS